MNLLDSLWALSYMAYGLLLLDETKRRLLRIIVRRNCFKCLSFFPFLSSFFLNIALKNHSDRSTHYSQFSWGLFCPLTFLVCLQLQIYDHGSLWEWPSENIWSECQKVFSENCLAAKLKNCMWATCSLFLTQWSCCVEAWSSAGWYWVLR